MGTYGVLRPVVHPQLGVGPQLGDGLLEAPPDGPPGQSVSGTTSGSDQLGRRHGHPPRHLLYHDDHRPPDVHPAGRCYPPRRPQIQLVTLNGNPAAYTVRGTNAGRQVFVSTPCSGQTQNVHIVAS